MLKEGRYYLTKDNRIFLMKATDYDKDTIWAFKGIIFNGDYLGEEYFTSDGLWGAEGTKSNYDIIKELTKEENPEYFL